MAILASVLSLSSQIHLHAFLSQIVVTAGTSTEATSNDVGPAAGSIKLPSLQALQHAFTYLLDLPWALTRRKYQRIIQGQLSLVDLLQLMATCSIIQGIRIWGRRSAAQKAQSETRDDERPGSNAWSLTSDTGSKSDPEVSDPGLLKKHSTLESYTTSYGTYSSIRTFYRPHPQADKLPSKPTPLPLLVFIHGLGGSLAQFHSLLTSLVNVAPCLGIDLPGCGRSGFSPRSWDAYTPKALAELLSVAVKQYCGKDACQGVVLVGHSMGCSYSALLASSTSSLHNSHGVEVLAIVAICPQATLPSDQQIATFEKLLLVPTAIFDIWRTWDRRGGAHSSSVARFVGKDADIEVKKLQERFNKQSQTAVWRRMAWGALPRRAVSKTGKNVVEKGMPGLEVWARLKIPLLLVGGESDSITKPDNIVQIGRALGKIDRSQSSTSTEPLTNSTEKELNSSGDMEHPSQDGKRQSTISTTEMTILGDDARPQGNTHNYSKKRQVLKTSILPSPASHALLYDPSTYRTLAGLIHTFLYEHVDTRLSLGWQLQHLSTEGKWDVKNLAKWQAIRPVSEPIAGIFRAMKTLREIDETHSPDIFVRNWKGKIRAVIDISHESPVYDPKGLDKGGIEYHKFPTVSKIPPTPEEVQDFIKFVDRLRAQTQSTPPSDATEDRSLIGVHCHYGFNRTGFFICCYLIEKEHFRVQEAIDLFAKCRPPGIRHEHFLDQLFVRYCIGLRRAPTL